MISKVQWLESTVCGPASEVMVVHPNLLVYSSEWLALRIATLTRNWMMV